jgi:hypothetical protein
MSNLLARSGSSGLREAAGQAGFHQIGTFCDVGLIALGRDRCRSLMGQAPISDD